MGPRHGRGRVTPHTRPPADEDGDHLLVRTVLCLDGERRARADLRARLRLRPRPAEWTLVGDDRHTADATGAGVTMQAADRHAARHRGRLGPRRGTCSSRESRSSARSRGPRIWPSPEDIDEANARWPPRRVLARLARPRADARPPLARADPALRAGDQGPHLHAHRRDRGRAHDLVARDARRRAQLGLPLHLDARLDLHPAGAALPQPRLGGGRVHAVRRRPRAQRRRGAADHVRDRRPPRPDRVDPRRPLGLRRGEPGAGRQRRLRPAPERRLRRGARLDPAAHAAQPAAAAAAVADRPVAGGVRDQGLARPRPGHLGGARQPRSTTSPRS